MALSILRKLGLSAEAVANGIEAVKALETIPYDLVPMDVQMPDRWLPDAKEGTGRRGLARDGLRDGESNLSGDLIVVKTNTLELEAQFERLKEAIDRMM